MSFLTATGTDIGTRKKTNQDSVLVLQADTDRGPVLLASICDGMGGLAKGEVASAAMVQALSQWFKNDLPKLLAEGFSEEKLWQQWTELINDTNVRISDYGRGFHVELGTTAAAVLVFNGRYYIVNVGDSRVYLLCDAIYQLTKDQTFVQQEIDAGRMTPQEAAMDSRQSILLQCIGATRMIYPKFLSGDLPKGSAFMLCCDGFRHFVAPEEFYQAFHPSRLKNRAVMEQIIQEMIKINISRGEDDNISAILVKT